MDGFQGYHLSYAASLFLAVGVTCFLMFASFVYDRIVLQAHLGHDVKENKRKIWGVCILAVGAAVLLGFAFPPSISIPAYLGLFVVAGTSGPFDLVLHWAWGVVQKLEKAAIQEREVKASKQHAEQLEAQIIAGGTT